MNDQQEHNFSPWKCFTIMLIFVSYQIMKFLETLRNSSKLGSKLVKSQYYCGGKISQANDIITNGQEHR